MKYLNLSKLATDYPASGIRRMFELAAGSDDAIRFTVGEPDFDTPAHVGAAAKAALDAHLTRYVSNSGIPELRQAIAANRTAAWGRPIGAESVLVTIGGMEALLLALQAVVNPGDEVLVPDPGYPNYQGQLLMVGAVAVPVPIAEENRFRMRAADVAARITPQTAAIVLNSPSNPLGTIAEDAELRKIAELARAHQLAIISDEVYERIVFDGRAYRSIAQVTENCTDALIVNSFSKTYAMTGWRCGWLTGPAEVIGRLAQLKEGISSCTPPFVQHGAIAALTGPQDAAEHMRQTFQERRDLVCEGVAAISGLRLVRPEGAFYAFINIAATGLTATEFATRLLAEQRVCVVPGSAFGAGGEGHVRLSFAASTQQIDEGLTRMGRFVAGLQRG